MVDRDAQQAGDVEDAVRRVGPKTRPTGIVESLDGRDRRRPGGREQRGDLLEPDPVEPRRESRLDPLPVRVILGRDACEP